MDTATIDYEARDRKQLRQMRRAINKLRRFPANTDPSVRHVEIMADCLAGRGYPMFEEEPLHCAVSMLAVCLSLYEAREVLHKATGEYFPPNA